LAGLRPLSECCPTDIFSSRGIMAPKGKGASPYTGKTPFVR
jgi:hypothetical protein